MHIDVNYRSAGKNIHTEKTCRSGVRNDGYEENKWRRGNVISLKKNCKPGNKIKGHRGNQ